MKLEEQVVSLELAKKLKELGVKQDSFFKWGKMAGEPRVFYPAMMTAFYDTLCSAFTVAELGEMLPEGDGGDYCKGYFTMDNEAYEYHPEYKEHCEIYRIGVWEKTEADARAKLLIHLIEEGLVIGDKTLVDGKLYEA